MTRLKESEVGWDGVGGDSFEQRKHQFQRLNQEMRKDTALSDLVMSVVQLLRKEGSRIEVE